MTSQFEVRASASCVRFRARCSALAIIATLSTQTPTAAQCCEPFPNPRIGLAATGVGDRILFAGGVESDVVDVFDVTSGAWSTAQLSIARSELVATSVGHLALFAGGYSYSHPVTTLMDRVDIYDDASGLWRADRLSVARRALAATRVGDLALFAGGMDDAVSPFGFTDRVDIFDASTGTWAIARLSQPRGWPGATAVGDTALFAGGYIGGAALVSDVVDLYSASSGEWSAAELVVPRYHIAAASAGPYALFAGGVVSVSGGSYCTDAVDVYDSRTGAWSYAKLSQARADIGVVSTGDRAYFAGGRPYPGAGAPSSRIDVFDARTGTWSSFDLPEGAAYMVAGAVGDEAVFAGGLGANALNYLDTVYRLPAGFSRPYCFGDGSGAPCPCGNTGAPGRGCASLGFGAVLRGSGCTSATADGLVLEGQFLEPGEQAIAFAAPETAGAGSGLAFGDGLRCTGGAATRLGIQTTSPSGAATWGPGLGALAGWSAGDLRRFQVWYRAPNGPCGSGFNLTNGLEVTFAP